MNLDELSRQKYGRSLAELDDATVYQLLMSVVSEKSAELPLNAGKKRLYYISAEFLIGKLLTNNLINLGLYDEAKRQLAEAFGRMLYRFHGNIGASRRWCGPQLPLWPFPPEVCRQSADNHA